MLNYGLKLKKNQFNLNKLLIHDKKWFKYLNCKSFSRINVPKLTYFFEINLGYLNEF